MQVFPWLGYYAARIRRFRGEEHRRSRCPLFRNYLPMVQKLGYQQEGGRRRLRRKVRSIVARTCLSPH